MLMRWLLIALLVAVPAAAHADVVTILSAIGYALQASGTYAAYAAYFYYAAAAIAVYGAVNQRRQARRSAARSKAEYNAGLSDRSVSAVTSDPPFRAIYGRCIVGGDIVAILTSDKQGTRDDGEAYTKADALKHLVIHLASREVEAIHDIYIDGVAIGVPTGDGWATSTDFSKTASGSRTATFTGSLSVGEPISVLSALVPGGGYEGHGWTPTDYTLADGGTTIVLPEGVTATVNYTVAPITGTVRVSKHLGDVDQAADTYLRGVLPAVWTADHRLRGRAYIVVTLDMDAEARFQGGPPNITADVSGHRLYDPRQDSTRGGSGTHRLADAGTWQWSENAALVTADFLASPLGYEVDRELDIDADYLMAAANACGTEIDLVVGDVTTTGPAYTCNGAFSATASKEAVLEDLCEAMGGFAVYGASWMLVAGTWTVPVLDLVDNDLDGQIEIVQAGAGMDAIFNGVRGTYVPAGKATPIDFAPYQNAVFVEADGRPLWSDLTLPYTDHPARCQNLARLVTERARDSLVIRYPAKLRAWPVQVGDRVTVTSAEYGFAAKTFRVTDWQFGITAPVVLTLQEDGPGSYDLADAVSADPEPNTNLPNPWYVAQLVVTEQPQSGSAYMLETADGVVVPRVFVQWEPVTDAYVADGTGRIEIGWRQNDGVDWTLITMPGDAINAYITGVREGDAIVIRLVAVNGIGARSEPLFLAHTVVGKQDAPSAPTGLAAVVGAGGWAVSVDEPPDEDWTTFELRRDGGSWDAAVSVFSARATHGVMPFLLTGSHTLRARHWAHARLSAQTTLALTVQTPAQPIVVGVPGRVLRLTWQDCTTTQPIARYEVSIGATYGASTIVSKQSATSHSRAEATAGTRLYWVVAIDMAGNASVPGYVELTSLPGIDEAIDILETGLADLVDVITDPTSGLDVTHALAETAAALAAGAEEIAAAASLLAEGASQDVAILHIEQETNSSTLLRTTLKQQTDDTAQTHALAIARQELTTSIEVVDDHVTAEAAARTALAVQVADDIASARSDLTTSIDTVDDRVTVEVADRTALAVQVADDLAAATSALTISIVAVDDRVTAEVTDRTELALHVGDFIAGASSQLMIRAAEDESMSMTQMRTALQQSYDDGKQTRAVAAAESRLTTSIGVVAGNLTAEAEARTALAVQVNEFQASATETLEVLVDENGRMRGQWVLSVTVGGKVAGAVLNNEAGVPTTFLILADKFAVALDDEDDGVFAFIVGMINGTPGVGINGNLFIDGSVIARHIDVDTLSAISANIGEVIAGLLRNDDASTFLDLNATGSDVALQVGGDALTVTADGDLTLKGDITASRISVGASSDATRFFDPAHPTISIQSTAAGVMAYSGNPGAVVVTSDDLLFKNNDGTWPFTRRIRTGTVFFSVVATTVVDDQFSLWMRTNGGTWTHLRKVTEPQSNYGSAALGYGLEITVAAGDTVQFGVSPTDETYHSYDMGKLELRDCTVTVQGRNF